MNILNKIILTAVTSAFALTACQSTQPISGEPKTSNEPSTGAISYTPRPVISLVLDKNSVHSWHLGKNASNERYLLIILDKSPVELMQSYEEKNFLAVNLGSEVFKNASSIQGGFLVLYPLSDSWTQEKIAEQLSK